MFQKSDPGLDARWTLGTVDQLVHGRDKLTRRVIVKYQNSNEDHHRLTDRSVRSLVKVWSCDDLNLDEDLANLQEKLSTTEAGLSLVRQVHAVGCRVAQVQTRCGASSKSTGGYVDHCQFTRTEEGDVSPVLQSLFSVFSVEANLTLIQPIADDDNLYDEEAMVKSQANDEKSLNGMLNSLSYLC